MRELVYYVAVSLDGYIADPQGRYDAFLGDGDHVEVVVGEYGDALPAHAHAAMGTTPPGTRFDTVVMGWDTLVPALEAGIASPYPYLRQVVASRRKREVADDVTLTDDPVGTVRRLKAEDGDLDLWLCGGGRLAGSLAADIDRLVLKRHPVLLGAGIPLVAGATDGPQPFAPVGSRTFGSGVVVEEYARVRA
ncbi:dihydrofolate reductase family protein [Lapillicoccus jejuensis]|uniref:Dihydrofolate reductase n=1 Tax=Lapillicoccus jejuensis TaxID=402171 RepID=A0A542DYS4_9MICO|nr:dihydrofolate reductase family protein [Lapillicoccus jejuensis]TQJ08250.1 dihydrofolate reductase [Lapillicoccus jejuensis]